MRLRYLWPIVILVAAACTPESEATPAPAATEAPAAATEAPATEAPAAATEAPAAATEAPATEAPATEAPAPEDEQASALPERCQQPPFDVELRRSGDGENEPFTVVDAEDNGLFVRDGASMGYKIFMVDFDIDDEQGLIDQIFIDDLPDGATLVTLDLGRFEDSEDPTSIAEYPTISAGEPLAISREAKGPDIVGTQVTIATKDGTTTNVSVDSVATGEVLYADATAVCVDVTIESESGFQFTGVVTARVRS